MYCSVKTNISLEDLAEMLEAEGDERKNAVAAELNFIEKQMTKHVLTEALSHVGVGDTLLHDVSKIVPSIDWVNDEAYLLLTFYSGLSDSTVSASATCRIKSSGQKCVKSIIISESLCTYPEIHFVEE